MLLPDLIHKRYQLLVGRLCPRLRKIFRHLLDRCHKVLRKIICHHDTEEKEKDKYSDYRHHHVLGQGKNIVALPRDP